MLVLNSQLLYWDSCKKEKSGGLSLWLILGTYFQIPEFYFLQEPMDCVFKGPDDTNPIDYLLPTFLLLSGLTIAVGIGLWKHRQIYRQIQRCIPNVDQEEP